MPEVQQLEVPLWSWFVLAGVVAASLVIDLFGHRGDRSLGRKAAIAWSAGWIALALGFGAWIAVQFGRAAGEDYMAAFVVEKALSLDNLFVFIVVFHRLKIPSSEQHRVLSWGILGAFATRALFIAAGAALLHAWHPVVYILGGFLIFTGIKTAREKEETGDGKVLSFLARVLPVSPRLHGHRFIAVEGGRRVVTPLLLAVLVVEITDVLFAVDSIPAVFAITKEPFIVYSSNIFAILGLRALYLVLADLLADLKYLRFGLAGILVFAGAKMLASDVLHLPHAASLAIIVGILLAAIVPSVVVRRRARATHHPA